MTLSEFKAAKASQPVKPPTALSSGSIMNLPDKDIRSCLEWGWCPICDYTVEEISGSKVAPKAYLCLMYGEHFFQVNTDGSVTHRP